MRTMQHEALDALREELPYFREHAVEAEALRRLPDETARRLRDTGVMRLLQPAKYGGYETEPQLFFEGLRLAGTACGATSWVAGVVGIHNWHLGLFDEEVQREVWGENPDTWLSSSYVDNGRAERVDGGYRLSGHWAFSSGVNHCDWALLGARVVGGEDPFADWLAIAVPRSDFEIIDTWNTIGLAGSGSNDVKVVDAFVPEHRVINFADTFAAVTPGQKSHPVPLYKMPWHAMFSSSIAAPVVGMAHGALSLYVEHQHERMKSGGVVPAAPADPTGSIRLAAAESNVDASWLQMVDNLTDMWDLVSAGEDVPESLRARTRRDQVMAADRSRAAVETVFEIAGGRGLAVGSPLQRMWRDAHAGASHVVNISGAALKAYGDRQMGWGELEVLL